MRSLGPDASQLAEDVSTLLDAEKAEDITVIDLQGKSGFADIMVIASGRSSRHVGAMADKLVQRLKALGLMPMVEGQQTCDWVLIDGGDVIVHLFRPEVRAFYNLEKMWGAASPVPAGVVGPALGKPEAVGLGV
ncbi:ribosome silencing factor [Novispirillum sp. DQ9]|uniref:ribosome silencing factor n=1 Tax=Novispirillum sp. DQ9 TaxID=3398612 RepID=UPI003C79BF86